MSIRIIKPGIYTTLQGLGRPGFQAAGVPVSGAMDKYAMRLANLLCGNKPGEVVLETTLHGAEWLAEEEKLIAFCGGGARLLINNQQAPFYKAIHVKASSLLSLKPSADGCRSYMAVAGGFKAHKVLNSASTYLPAGFGGLHGKALKAGDLLEPNRGRSNLSGRIISDLKLQGKDFITSGWSVETGIQKGHTEKIIRVIKGPEWGWFDELESKKLFTESFGISNQSNRIGYRLHGKSFLLKEKREMISTAVCPGTVQVTHEGALVLLMADAQTTGGYPRLAQVASVDLQACAQLRPGDSIHFREISIDTAEELYLEKEKLLRQTQQSIFLKYHTEQDDKGL